MLALHAMRFVKHIVVSTSGFYLRRFYALNHQAVGENCTILVWKGLE